jgi:hypothetical protein
MFDGGAAPEGRTAMDVNKILAELRQEREQVEEAIEWLGRLRHPPDHSEHHGAGITTKSISFSQTVSANGELVDITGSLNVVRLINYGEKANTVVLYGNLAPNVTAIGRTSGKHYVPQGTAAIGRTLPPGPIPDTVTVNLPFAIFPPSAVPDIVEDYPPTDYPLIVKVIALVIAAVIG